MKNYLFWTGCLFVCCGVFPGWAQESGTATQGTSLAETMARLDRLESKLQEVAGNQETQNVLMNQLGQKVDRTYLDLEMRLNALEGRLKLFQSALERSLEKVSPAAAQEFKQFQKGLDLVQNNDYAAALKEFEKFVKSYPKSAHKGEALYWIGECRYALHDFTQAIKDLQKFVETYPKADQAPAAILKQCDGFLQLNMPDEAKVFCQKLVREYPNTPEAANAKGKLTALEEKGEAITKLPGAPNQKVPTTREEF